MLICSHFKLDYNRQQHSEVCCSVWPVVQQDVGAFDISVQKIVLVAVVQALHQLAHEAANMLMGELHQARLQQAHQVMVHVLEDQVKST